MDGKTKREMSQSSTGHFPYFTRVKGYKERYGDESDSWTRSLKGSSRVAIFRRAKVQYDTRLRGSFVH